MRSLANGPVMSISIDLFIKTETIAGSFCLLSPLRISSLDTIECFSPRFDSYFGKPAADENVFQET